MSDASGNLLAEIDYLDYGEPVYMPVLASPPQDDITNSVYDSGNKTTLIIGIGDASWIGCELRIARPGASADRYLSCEVMNSNGNDTLVYDPNGARDWATAICR